MKDGSAKKRIKKRNAEFSDVIGYLWVKNDDRRYDVYVNGYKDDDDRQREPYGGHAYV